MRNDVQKHQITGNQLFILITAAWSHINHDKNVVLVGKIKIKELLSVMGTHFPFIRQKTKQIYGESLFGK